MVKKRLSVLAVGILLLSLTATPAFARLEQKLTQSTRDCLGLLVQRGYNLQQVLAGAGTEWQTKINYDELERRYYRGGDIDWVGWEHFLERQPGTMVTLSSGRRVRILFIRSNNPKATEVDYTLGGIGYDVERYLIQDFKYIDRMDTDSHNVLIETGGLTEFDEFLHSRGKPRDVMELSEVATDVNEAIKWMQTFLKYGEGIAVPDRVNLIGLSAGGWFLQYFAAQSEYAPFIKQLVLQAPGGQSLDEYFNSFVRPLKDMAESLHPFQKPWVDMFNHAAQSSTSWARIFGLPIFMEPPTLHTLHEMLQHGYRHGARSAMGSAFKAFHEDRLRLQFATARVMGLSRANGTNLIRRIDPRIHIHFILGGKDLIVPPGLLARLVKATAERGPHPDTGQLGYTVLFFEDLEHDVQASEDPNVAELTQDLLMGTHARGAFLIRAGHAPVAVGIDELVTTLKGLEPLYIESNRQFLRAISR